MARACSSLCFRLAATNNKNKTHDLFKVYGSCQLERRTWCGGGGRLRLCWGGGLWWGLRACVSRHSCASVSARSHVPSSSVESLGPQQRVASVRTRRAQGRWSAGGFALGVWQSARFLIKPVVLFAASPASNHGGFKGVLQRRPC